MNKSILIVEDEAMTVLAYKVILEKAGYKIFDPAPNGEAALLALEGIHPDLILMDVMLNGKFNGFETAVKIRERKNTPVLFLTGYDDATTKEKLNAFENSSFLIKPFPSEKLIQKIRSLLS